jgi:hypothetical protein
MGGAEDGPGGERILLHSRSEQRDAYEAKAQQARVARRGQAATAAAVLFDRARPAALREAGEPFLVTLMAELLAEFHVQEVTLALADAGAGGWLYRVSPCQTSGDLAARNGSAATVERQDGGPRYRTNHSQLPAGLSGELPRSIGSFPAASSLSAFGYAAGRRSPIAILGVHSRNRRPFEPREVALLDAVMESLLKELGDLGSAASGAMWAEARPLSAVSAAGIR